MIRFSIHRNSVENPTGENILQVGVNLFTGEKDFESSFGTLTAIESDLLLIASSIFAADRASKRGEREDLCRNFELQIPVTNFEKLLPLVPQIEKILRLLSNDSWQIRLRHDSGTAQDNEISDCSCQGKTLLFSFMSHDCPSLEFALTTNMGNGYRGTSSAMKNVPSPLTCCAMPMQSADRLAQTCL